MLQVTICSTFGIKIGIFVHRWSYVASSVVCFLKVASESVGTISSMIYRIFVCRMTHYDYFEIVSQSYVDFALYVHDMLSTPLPSQYSIL